MRVLLVSASYHPVLGGLQTVTHQLAMALLASRHEVRVVTNLYPRSLPSRETLDGVQIERWLFLNTFADSLRDRRPDLAIASAYYNYATEARFAGLVKRFHPDIVNVHFPEARLETVLRVRRRFPFRLVVSVHGDDTQRITRLKVIRDFLRSADAVTACSTYLLDRATTLESSIAGKSHVIHNGVDLTRFCDTAAHPHPRPYLLAYGRFVYKKGFDLLLEAFASVNARFPDLDLILAGDGPERERLASLANSSRIIFFGRAHPDQIVRLLNGARLVVIPSREEPFGIVALEALLAARPIVATRVGGLPELARTLDAQIQWAEPAACDIASAINQALSQPFVPRQSQVRGLSIDDMAGKYIRVLSEAAMKPGRLIA